MRKASKLNILFKCSTIVFNGFKVFCRRTVLVNSVHNVYTKSTQCVQFICCIFLGGGVSHWRIFHSYGDGTIVGEGLQIVTYAWLPWPLSIGGSFACHTYRDKGHPLIMVISEDPWHSIYCRAFSSVAVTTCSYDLCLWRLGFAIYLSIFVYKRFPFIIW